VRQQVGRVFVEARVERLFGDRGEFAGQAQGFGLDAALTAGHRGQRTFVEGVALFRAGREQVVDRLAALALHLGELDGLQARAGQAVLQATQQLVLREHAQAQDLGASGLGGLASVEGFQEQLELAADAVAAVGRRLQQLAQLQASFGEDRRGTRGRSALEGGVHQRGQLAGLGVGADLRGEQAQTLQTQVVLGERAQGHRARGGDLDVAARRRQPAQLGRLIGHQVHAEEARVGVRQAALVGQLEAQAQGAFDGGLEEQGR
jgi:hypothetical protein